MKFRGRTFLLYIGDGSGGYELVGAQRSTSMTVGVEQIDTTDKDDTRFRKLMEGGPQQIDISATGLIERAAVQRLAQLALAGTITPFRLLFVTSTWTLDVSMQLVTFELSGEYSGPSQYNLTLTGSTGPDEGDNCYLVVTEHGAAVVINEDGDYIEVCGAGDGEEPDVTSDSDGEPSGPAVFRWTVIGGPPAFNGGSFPALGATGTFSLPDEAAELIIGDANGDAPSIWPGLQIDGQDIVDYGPGIDGLIEPGNVRLPIPSTLGPGALVSTNFFQADFAGRFAVHITAESGGAVVTGAPYITYYFSA